MTHRYSNNHWCFFLAWHPNSYERDGGFWSFLTWTKSHLSLHQHPEMSCEVVEETLLILQENQGDFLLELIAAVSRWMFSGLDLLQGVWFVPSAIGKINSPFSLGNITSFAWSLFKKISDASIVSNSSRSATNTSPFQIHPAYNAYPRNNPGKTFSPNWWILDWSFAVTGWYSTNEPKWNNRSFKWLPKTSFIRRLPIR